MKNIPIVSRYRIFKNRKRILENPLLFHRECFNEYGSEFRIKIGFNNLIVFTKHPSLVKHLLQKQHRKYNKSKFQTVDVAKYIGHGILTSNGEHWRTHRRMVQPAFHKKKLIGLLGIMRGAINQELKKICPNREQDVLPIMGDIAFQVVAKSLFSSNDYEQEMKELQSISTRNQIMLAKEMRQPYLKWWFYLNGSTTKHLQLAKKAQNILNSLIETRIVSEENKDDLLDMLLKSRYEDGTPMPRKQLIDEILVLFTAGYETTASALSFTLFLLAKNPEMQQKAYEEIQQVDIEGDAILENIMKLKYVKQCIEESLRLYPPAFIIDRISTEEDEHEGRIIPKDSMVLMSIYELHRNSDFWDNPDSFIPERFSEENQKEYKDYYYPFGAGPRMCVGNNFAMYEMILIVAKILKDYTLNSAVAEATLNPMITLKPVNLFVKFKSRI